MIKAKCPKCGTQRFGWALLNPRHQACPKCGAGLEIKNGNLIISKGYSPFTADKHIVNLSNDLDHPIDKERDIRIKDE